MTPQSRVIFRSSVTAVLFAASSYVWTQTAAATGTSVSLGSTSESAQTTITFEYTLTSQVGNGQDILNATKPSGFTLTPVSGSSLTSALTVWFNDQVQTASSVLNQEAITTNGITIGLAGSSLTAGTKVKIQIGGTYVTNPATAGTYTWQWKTAQGNGTAIENFSAAVTVGGVSQSTTATQATNSSTTSTTTSANVGQTTSTVGTTPTIAAGSPVTPSSNPIELDPRPTADDDITELVNVKLDATDKSNQTGGQMTLRRVPGGPLLELVSVTVTKVDLKTGGVSSQGVVSASPELNVTTPYTGADYNKPEVWQAEGFGQRCWKYDFTISDVYTSLLASPPQVPGVDGTNWEYTTVIVKAGSLTTTDPAFQVNTLFNKPGPGMAVFADVNRNGISDPGGRNGDKGISHIVYCASPKSSLTSTTIAGQTTSTVSATQSTASSSTSAPTTSSSVASTTTAVTTTSTTTTVTTTTVAATNTSAVSTSTTTTGTGQASTTSTIARSSTTLAPTATTSGSGRTTSTVPDDETDPPIRIQILTEEKPSPTTTLNPTSSTAAGSSTTPTTSVREITDEDARVRAMRANCGVRSRTEPVVANIDMVVSRGTSQELVQFEVCLNEFTMISSNVDTEKIVDANTLVAVGGGASTAPWGFLLVLVGAMLYVVRRRLIAS